MKNTEAKKWTIKEIRELTGLDRKRINDYRAEVPEVGYSNRGYEGHTGYKVYDDEGLNDFILISLLIGLQLERKTIKEVVLKKRKGEKNSNDILDLAIETAKEKIQLYQDVITIAEYFKKVGIENMGPVFGVASVHEVAEYVNGFNKMLSGFMPSFENIGAEFRDEIKKKISMFKDCTEDKTWERALKYLEELGELFRKNNIIITPMMAISTATCIEYQMTEELYSYAKKEFGEDALEELSQTIFYKYNNQILGELELFKSDEFFVKLQNPEDPIVKEGIEKLRIVAERYYPIISDRHFYAVIKLIFDEVEITWMDHPGYKNIKSDWLNAIRTFYKL